MQFLSPTFIAHLWRCSDRGGKVSCSYVFNPWRNISGDTVQEFKHRHQNIGDMGTSNIMKEFEFAETFIFGRFYSNLQKLRNRQNTQKRTEILVVRKVVCNNFRKVVCQQLSNFWRNSPEIHLSVSFTSGDPLYQYFKSVQKFNKQVRWRMSLTCRWNLLFQNGLPLFFFLIVYLVSCLVGVFSFICTYIIKISRCIYICHEYFKMQLRYLDE